jgi:hypothetical protein
MNDNTKINLVINSKKLRGINQNANNIVLPIDDGLIRCDPKTQYLELNIVSWIMKNDFYNTQDANNKFLITFKDDDGIILSSSMKIIEPGNYNVIEMQSKLKDLLSDVCSIEYLSTLNKYKFRKNNGTFNAFITSISANDFIGFDNNYEYEITELGLISTNVLNMAGDSIIILEIPNLQTNPRILDNISTGSVSPSSTMAYIVIDVPSYGLLKYENGDSGDSFSYILMNNDIKYLNLVIRNQDKEVIEVSDYDLTLQFIIHNRNNSTQLAVLKNIDKSLSRIVQMLGDLWSKYTKK